MYLVHHGVKGMRWGVRRYQRPDGTRTPLGKKRDAGKTSSQNRSGTKRSPKGSSDGEQEERKGLSKNQKIAIGVGVGVVGTALAVYGGYKVSKYLGARKEEARLAADIIKTVKNAKITADSDLYSSKSDSTNRILSKRTTIDSPNTRRLLNTQPARRQLEIADTAGASKMSNLEFINAQTRASDNRAMESMRKSHKEAMSPINKKTTNDASYKLWMENHKDSEFWRDARDLYSRPDFKQLEARANKQAYKDATREAKAYRKENRHREKELKNEGAAIDKYYKNLAKETKKENKRALKEYNKKARRGW